MKPIVLLVEDLEEEQKRGRKAINDQGFNAAVAGSLESANKIWSDLGDHIVGVITDLHYLERVKDEDASKPSGLAIVMKAVTKKLPVVIVSNINHHNADYLQSIVSDLEKLAEVKIPFIMDNKDWDRAVKELQSLIKEE